MMTTMVVVVATTPSHLLMVPEEDTVEEDEVMAAMKHMPVSRDDEGNLPDTPRTIWRMFEAHVSDAREEWI